MNKPKNYYCHRQNLKEKLNTKEQLDHHDLQIIQKIGEGSFGTVYKVFDPKQSKLLVIKKSKFNNGVDLIKEGQILKELSNSEGFDSISLKKQYSSNQIYMECLGPSLSSILRKTKAINSHSLKRIGYQLIKRLKELHDHHFVHRDLKPDNILLGNHTEPHSIFLIDFGLATSFRRKALSTKKVYEGVVGTAKFCSIASHNGLQQFPKDDLECLGYILLQLLTGSLPWDHYKAQDQKKLFQKIKKAKEQSGIEQLCAGLPSLRKYFKIIKHLQVGDQIQYQQILKIFEVENDGPEFCFDFCENIRQRCNFSMKQSLNKKSEAITEGRANRIRGSILS